MKPEPENLLADMLGESLGPEVRRSLLASAVRSARWARVRRMASRAGGVALGMLALGAGLWWLAGGARDSAGGARAAYALVRTEGAPASLRVETMPFTGVLHSGRGTFLAVRTDVMQPSYMPLTDLELLAFFGGRGAMLVRDSGRVTLFLNGRPVGRGDAFSLERGGGG